VTGRVPSYFFLALRFAFFAGFFFAAFFLAAMCFPLLCAVSLVPARRGGGLWHPRAAGSRMIQRRGYALTVRALRARSIALDSRVTRSSRMCPAASRSTARRSTPTGRCDRIDARASGVANVPWGCAGKVVPRDGGSTL
jgi:hypothetical protein